LKPKTVKIITANNRNHAFNLAKAITRTEKPDFIFTQWKTGARCYKRMHENGQTIYRDLI